MEGYTRSVTELHDVITEHVHTKKNIENDVRFSSRLYYPFGKGPGQHMGTSRSANDIQYFDTTYRQLK